MRARQIPWITPGTGKTHLACALAVAACAAGGSVYFTTLDDMIRKLRTADAAGDLGRQLRGYLRSSILIIDEVGYLPLNRHDANLVFQIIARRYEKGSVIITSNKTFSEWGQVFTDDVLATAHPRPVPAPLRGHHHQRTQLAHERQEPHHRHQPAHAIINPPGSRQTSTSGRTPTDT
jgi:hypothetical protein